MSASVNNSYNQIKVMNGFFTFSQIIDGHELWGVKNCQDEKVIPCKYEGIRPFNSEYISVKKDGLWGFIDIQGEEVIPCKYQDQYLDKEVWLGIDKVENKKTEEGILETYRREEIRLLFKI